jgi:hypothetical protein
MSLVKIIQVGLIAGTIAGIVGIGNAMKAIKEDKPWGMSLLYTSEIVYIISGSLKVVPKKDKNDKTIYFY